MTAEEGGRKHSDSPSRDDGGIVDWFGYDGKMPGSVTAAAFALKPGELSKPVVSSFGVHLVELLERRPGQLCAEDVRPRSWSGSPASAGTKRGRLAEEVRQDHAAGP